MEIYGDEGDKIGWLSSCGIYNVTIVDGVDRTITFDCSNPQENAPGFGYFYADYQCYGSGAKALNPVPSSGLSCKSRNAWKSEADKLCVDMCGVEKVETGKGIYENQTLCGVKSFGISQECNLGLFQRLFNWFMKIFGK